MAIPEEVMIEIFTRLPPKAVGRCRCLSKPWRTILSSPQFLESHRNQNRKTHHQQNLLLVSAHFDLHTIAEIKNETVSRKLPLIDEWEEAVGSCEGLVLLLNERSEKILLNPITLESKTIPDSPLALDRSESHSLHSFGYDASTDDYKIVTISFFDTEEHDPDIFDTFVDVYCVKKGFWKRVGVSPYDLSQARRCSGACVNGAVHWLAPSREPGDYRAVIAAFDLATEVFGEIPVPNGGRINFGSCLLMELGGRLCLMNGDHGSKRTDIWIMEEYGLADSWTKFTIDCNYKWTLLKPLCFIGDEEVALVCDAEEVLLLYNLKKNTLSHMVVDGKSAYVIDGSVFVGSLVSP